MRRRSPAFEAVLALDPSNWKDYRNLAATYWKIGKRQNSTDAYESAIRVNPKAVDVYIDLAKAQEANGELRKSAEALKRGPDVARSLGDAENVDQMNRLLNGTK